MTRYDPAALPDEDEAPFDLKQIVLYGAARSARLIAILTVIGACAGIFVAASMPNTFTSTMSMTLYSGVRERQNVESGVGIENDSKWGPGMEDEVELLSDPAVYERVAKELGPAWVLEVPDPAGNGSATILHRFQRILIAMRAESPDKLTADNPLAVRKAGRRILANTRIAPVRRSAVLKIHHTAYSPERARKIAEALVSAFQDRHREQYQAEKHYHRQIRERDNAFESFKNAEKLYREHRADCGFIDLAKQKDTLFAALQRLDQELADGRARKVEIEAEAEALQKALTGMDELVVLPANLIANPEFQEWQRRLFSLESDLVLLEGKTGAKVTLDRERQSIERQIKSVRQRLESLDAFISTDPAAARRVPNQERLRLVAKVTELHAEHAGLIKSLESDAASRRRTEEQLELAFQCETTHKVMELEVATEEGLYAKLTRKTKELEGLASLDEEGVSNLALTIPPNLPTSKAGPQRIKPLAAGLFGGLFLGLAVAILVQLSDRRLRYPDTLERDLGIRLLTVVDDVPALHPSQADEAA
ncbi:MAG: hypothetical protein GY711_26425 [bacterium]|nr:hypothetical protein [bacterium]